MPRQPRQTGAAMMLVLIILAIATVTGMSYMATASINAAASEGHLDAARARQLAESGVQHAMCLLRENPDMLQGSDVTPLGPFPVDDRGDSYTLSVAQASIVGQFEIVSRATSGRSTQTVCAIVQHVGGVRHQSRHALLSNGTVGMVPFSLRVDGSMHVNGSAFVFGEVTGDVSATGAVGGAGTIGGARIPGAAGEGLPSLDPDDYETYVWGELPGEATAITTNLITEGAPIDKGNAVTAANPAGVVVARPATGSLWLWEKLRFKGTLVVHGDVVLDGWDMDLESQEGFPVVIATGRLFISYWARDVHIDGLVYAGGGIYSYGDTTPSDTRLHGGLICGVNGYSSSIYGDHELKLNDKWATILDPQGWGTGGTVEILRWQE